MKKATKQKIANKGQVKQVVQVRDYIFLHMYHEQRLDATRTNAKMKMILPSGITYTSEK